MAVYLVTYDLNKEVVRPNITEKIKSLGGYAKLSESSYAIDVDLTVDQVFDALKPLIDNNDQIYILTLSQPMAGFGYTNINKWLEDYMPVPASIHRY